MSRENVLTEKEKKLDSQQINIHYHSKVCGQ